MSVSTQPASAALLADIVKILRAKKANVGLYLDVAVGLTGLAISCVPSEAQQSMVASVAERIILDCAPQMLCGTALLAIETLPPPSLH